MAGLDEDFTRSLERVARVLADGDDPDALATLDDLVRHEDEDQIYYAMLMHVARADFTRVLAYLDRLAELAETEDKRHWLSEQRGIMLEAQRVSGPDISVSFLPRNTGIDDLLGPIVARRISRGR